MTATEQWAEAMQYALDTLGLSQLDAISYVARTYPDLWLHAKSERARHAVQMGLIKSVDQPLDYHMQRRVQQAMARGAPTPAPRGEERMSATDTLMKMARDLVDRGEAETIGKALDVLGPRHQDLWRQHRTEAMPPEQVPARKTVDPQQVPPFGAPPEQRPPPARSAGHAQFDALVAAEKVRHPDWSDAQCQQAVFASEQGVAAMAQNRAEVLSGRRGQ
jgi:hypothetical protein